MKSWIIALSTLSLAGCATFGSTPQYRATGIGAVSDGVECVADEITDEGWTVPSSSEAGLVRGELGANWVQATLLPSQEISAASYVIEVATADTEPSRELAADIIENCGT